MLEVTDTNGCTGKDSITVGIFPNPEITLPDDTIVCDVIQLAVDAGNGFAEYLWNDNSTQQTLLIRSAGSYSVTVTDNNNCTAFDGMQVTISTSTGAIVARDDTTICAGETVQLFVTGAATYTWTPDVTLSDPNIFNPVATPVAATTYFVSAVDSAGCVKMDSVQIDILPLLTAQADADSVVCFGNTVQLTATGGADFSWTPTVGLSCTNCPNPVATLDQTRTYEVIVSQAGYCNTDTAEVTVNVLPLPNVGADSVITISKGSEVTILIDANWRDYTWLPSPGLTCYNCLDPTASPQATTVYTLTVTDAAGCTATKKFTVEVLDDCLGKFTIPTAFSPNHDGMNDEFRILHGGDLQLVNFKVFNRWGEIVFETEDPDLGWDGYYKGWDDSGKRKMQDLAVFVYYVQLTCGEKIETIIGNVTLVH